MLWAIWTLSIALAGVSLTTMTGLIASRALTRGRAARLASHRRALLEALLLWGEGICDEEQVLTLMRKDRAVAIDVLIELFENLRGDSQSRLASLADRAGLVDQVRTLLAKGSIRDRMAAAECLLWFPGEATTAALLQATGDRQIEVSLAAAGSLVDLAPDFPLETLLASRLDHPDASRRLEDLLTRLGKHSPQRLLAIAEDEARSDRLRVAALEALASTGASEALDRITALSSSPLVDIRAAAARCLGAIGHPASQDTIRRLLGDPAWQVRVRAADAAGALGALELGEALVALVEDENWWVRLRSAEALARLGESGIGALKAIIADRSKPDPAQTAALVLAEYSGAA